MIFKDRDEIYNRAQTERAGWNTSLVFPLLGFTTQSFLSDMFDFGLPKSNHLRNGHRMPLCLRR